MKAIKNIQKWGVTVIWTIHQPRSNIFLHFDQLLLLFGGETVYFGKALQSLAYFKNLGYSCPRYLNPGDFLIDILDEENLNKVNEDGDMHSIESTEIEFDQESSSILSSIRDEDDVPFLRERSSGSSTDKGKSKSNHQPIINQHIEDELNQSIITPQTLIKAFEKSFDHDKLLKFFPNDNEQEEGELEKKEKTSSKINDLQISKLDRPISIWKQLKVLSYRSFLSTIRDPGIMYVRTIIVILTALLLGAIFFNQPDDESSVHDRVNVILFSLCIFLLICIPSISKLMDENLLFMREKVRDTYRTSIFFFSNLLIELPILIILVGTYSAISYWMVQLRPEWNSFLFFYAIILLVVLTLFSIIRLIATLVKSVNVAFLIYFIVSVYSVLLGGFIDPLDDLKTKAKWIVKTSFLYYGYEALILNEFEGKPYGDDILEQFQNEDKFLDLYILLAIVLVLRLISYIIVRITLFFQSINKSK